MEINPIRTQGVKSWQTRILKQLFLAILKDVKEHVLINFKNKKIKITKE